MNRQRLNYRASSYLTLWFMVAALKDGWHLIELGASLEVRQ